MIINRGLNLLKKGFMFLSGILTYQSKTDYSLDISYDMPKWTDKPEDIYKIIEKGEEKYGRKNKRNY